MTRNSFLTSMAAAAARPLLAQTGKRNLVLILSDDHRYDMMSCLGHPWVKTPHMDRLAADGVLFRNAFVTTSLCSPSRASILTGQYVHAHGVTDNITRLPSHLMTFPQVLREHGIELFTANTNKAVERFNEFAGKGENVAAALHLTC